METVTYRFLLPAEIERLRARIPAWPMVLSGAVGVAVLAAIPFLLAALVLERLFHPGESVQRLAFGVLVIWSAFVFVRSLRTRLDRYRILRGDLQDSKVEVHRYRAIAATRIRYEDDETFSYLLKLMDGRVLWLDGPAAAQAAARGAFPCSEFAVEYTAKSRQIFALTPAGSALQSRQVEWNAALRSLPSPTGEDHAEYVPLDYERLETDAASLVELGAPASRRAWMTPELVLAACATLIHLALTAFSWHHGAGQEEEAAGEPCASGNTLADSHIWRCEEIYYPIVGVTGKQLWDSIEVSSPIHESDGQHVTAYSSYVKYKTYWKWDTEKLDKGQCRVSTVDAHVRLQYFMPRWLDRDKASAEMQARYAEWLKAGWALSNRFAGFEIDAAREIDETIRKLPAEDCEALDKRIQVVGSQIIHSQDQRRRAWRADPENRAIALASRDWMKQ